MVAVVVTHDPGPWFEETLASIRDQTYRGLSVLVIDAASGTDPTPRIAAVLPTAYVRRLGGNPGFGAAANELLGAVEGAAFYLVCHDDVALGPDTVRTLVEEAFRSNAGIVAPKLVDWERPGELRQVGASIDKTGVVVPFAEPGELDQEQHDAVRDVFLVPGGCTLVRADLFAALGGFDSGISYHGEDLDLCWRAHVAGARVLIVPSTDVRHLEALGLRRGIDDRRRLQARHRLRTVLSCYRPFHLLRVLPQAVLSTLAEALYALAAGRPGQARDVLGAWGWNLRRVFQIRRKRKAIRRTRTVSDGEIRDLQVRGSARLTAFVRGQIGGGDDRLSEVSRSSRQFADRLRARSNRGAIVIGGIVAALVVLGSRHLLVGSIPAVGEFANFPDSPVTLLKAWGSGWRPAGLGSDNAAPTGLGLFGGAGSLLLGGTGLLRVLLIVGLLPLGMIGAWRLSRPLGSLRASVAAFVVYAAIPVPYNALARGSWGGLALYAAAPWLLLQVARASRLAPFGRADFLADSTEAAVTQPSRTLLRQVIVLGVLLAVVGAFVPFVVAVAVLVAVGCVLGSLLCGRARGSGRLLAGVLGGSAVAFLLHLPWSAEFVRPGATWTAFAGIRSGSGGGVGAGALLRFETGPLGGSPLGWAFLVAAALPIVIGKAWRYEWAVRAWFVALAGWGLVWTGQRGWLPVELPPAEVLLAPVAAALALATALGVAAFEVDLPGYRFGWRQAGSTVARLAVIVGIVPLVPGVIDGRWHVPGGDLGRPLAAVLERDRDVGSRVLWVGDPDVLPLGGWELDDGLHYAVSTGVPTIADRWPGPGDDATSLLRESIRLAAERRTTRLGALLTPMGVRYLVLPVRSTPAAFEGVARPLPQSLADVFAEQLDLQRIESDPAMIVYRNTSWAGRAMQLPVGTVPGTHFTDALDDVLASWRPVLRRRSATLLDGAVGRPGTVLLAEAASPNWSLELDGDGVARTTAFGWANRFDVDRSGTARLHYETPTLRYLLCGFQVVLWLVSLLVLYRSSPRRSDRRRSRRSGPVGAVSDDRRQSQPANEALVGVGAEAGAEA